MMTYHMDNNMTARNYGVLDGYFAPYVAISKLSKKVQTYQVVGNNPDIDTSNIEDIWANGGRYPYQSGASFLNLSSTSVNDTVGGTGLEFIDVLGLNENYDITREVMALNGTSLVASANQYIRILTITGSKPDWPGFNVKALGTITLNTSGVAVQGQIDPGDTASSMALFTVPRNYVGFFDQLVLSGGANDDFIVSFSTRKVDDIFTSRGDFEITNSNVHDLNFDPRLGAIPEMADIKAEAVGVSVNAQVRVMFTVTIIRKNYLDSLIESI